MTAPRSDVVQMAWQNPHATMPLIVPVLVVCNTSDDDLERNVRENSSRPDLPWIGMEKPHEGRAVLVGGGPSVADHIEEIARLQRRGYDVFAMNGAARFLNEHGIFCEYQVVADAKHETVDLVFPHAKAHLFASQVNPATMLAGRRVRLWHLGIEGMEDWFPEWRVKQGGYALIGGGAAVGNSACCLAYVMGYRDFHVFGFDSSHRDGESHAYDQPMNRFIPSVDVEWAGKTYHSSLAMKAQAEKFQMTARELERLGCKLTLYGEGLLQTMFTTPASDLTEQDKYRAIWQFDDYRTRSFGEENIPLFLEVVKPDGLIVDFGCGTGRAGLALKEAGHACYMIDFADNCRDEEALCLPFLCWDLARPIPVRAPYGMCSDVLEHIPPESVEMVVRNIMEAAKGVFFNISTVPDVFGDVIGTPLHLSVHPHDWWRNLFADLGFHISWEREQEASSLFYVTQSSQKGH